MLVVMFVLLFSLVYTPGVKVEISAALADSGRGHQNHPQQRDGLSGTTYKSTELAQLRNAIENAPSNLGLSIQREPGGPADLEKQVNALLSIQLPKSDNWTSTDNPKIIVNVNLLGQIYYENKMVDETELKKAAGRLAQSASKESAELTMVLRADKGSEK